MRRRGNQEGAMTRDEEVRNADMELGREERRESTAKDMNWEPRM